MNRFWDPVFAASLGLLGSLTLAIPAQAQSDAAAVEQPSPPTRHSPQAPDTEEILVTGTYIKGLSEENLASPMESISRDDILDIGAFRIEDIINNLTINTGSENNVDAFTQNFTTGTGNINLRGLGVASTLVLLNSRRQTYSAFTTDKGENFVDTSSLVPLIAVEKVEILKDGAASLYGSDAVAGVVNFITRKDFEGFDIDLEALTGGQGQADNTISAIYGANWGNSSNFMIAVSGFDRDELSTADRRFSRPEDDTSSAGFPGTYIVPAFPFAGTPEVQAAWSNRYDSNSNFQADYFEGMPGAEIPFMADPNCHNVVDSTTVPPDNHRANDPENLTGLCRFDFGSFFSLVPEEKRNQLFSSLDFSFNNGMELDIELGLASNEAKRRNTPSFPITSRPVICGNGAPGTGAIDASCALEPTKQHPDNPFGGDIVFIGRTLASGSEAQITEHNSDTSRVASALSGSINEKWDWEFSYVTSKNDFELVGHDTLKAEFESSLMGLGGENCSGNVLDAGNNTTCFFYNPFAAAAPETANANSDEILDYVTGNLTIDAESALDTLSASANGSLFAMAGGDAGIAVGIQTRKESLDYDYDKNSNKNNFLFFVGNPDFSGSRDIKAAFTELALPISDSVNMQLSLRYEDYEDSGNSTDPKLAVLYRPNDAISLRASVSTSFRAPSLFQQQGIQTTLGEITTASGTQFLAVRAEANPDDPLKPESADVMNLGASWTSEAQAFQLSADYWSYDYSNVIIKQNAQAIHDAALAGDPQAESQVIGDDISAGDIQRINVFYDNASSLETDGVDITADYTWPGDSGSLYEVGIDLSKTLSYDLEDPQAGSVDGLGKRNFENFATSVPELRANLHFSWTLNQHTFNAFARFIDSYINDQKDAVTRLPKNETIDSITTFDLQYSYQFESFGPADEGLTLTVGGINVTDEDPPYVSTNGGYDSKVHDPRGALFYVKLNVPLL
jgi:iron complex outermembrane receptor protein